MWEPILVTPLPKMRPHYQTRSQGTRLPHYSQSNCESGTPSSGSTSAWASYKEVTHRGANPCIHLITTLLRGRYHRTAKPSQTNWKRPSYYQPRFNNYFCISFLLLGAVTLAVSPVSKWLLPTRKQRLSVTASGKFPSIRQKEQKFFHDSHLTLLPKWRKRVRKKSNCRPTVDIHPHH